MLNGIPVFLFEEVDVKNIERVEDNDVILGYVTCTVANPLVPTKNNTIYSLELWTYLLNSPEFKRKLERGLYMGNLDHPEKVKQKAMDASHTLVSLWIQDGMIWAKFKIFADEKGKKLWILLRGGVKLGMSLRASGDDRKVDRHDYIIPETFKLEGFDFVGDESAPGAMFQHFEETVGNYYDEVKPLFESIQEDRLMKDRFNFQPYYESVKKIIGEKDMSKKRTIKKENVKMEEVKVETPKIEENKMESPYWQDWENLTDEQQAEFKGGFEDYVASRKEKHIEEETVKPKIDPKKFLESIELINAKKLIESLKIQLGDTKKLLEDRNTELTTLKTENGKLTASVKLFEQNTKLLEDSNRKLKKDYMESADKSGNLNDRVKILEEELNAKKNEPRRDLTEEVIVSISKKSSGEDTAHQFDFVKNSIKKHLKNR